MAERGCATVTVTHTFDDWDTRCSKLHEAVWDTHHPQSLQLPQLPQLLALGSPGAYVHVAVGPPRGQPPPPPRPTGRAPCGRIPGGWVWHKASPPPPRGGGGVRAGMH